MKTIPRWTLVAALTLFALPGRADAPPGRFVATNGTVADTLTTLEWQQVDDDAYRTQDVARTYCNGLTLGGSSDWRLPTVKELLTLVNHELTPSSPSIEPVFTGTDNEVYWSTTPLAGSASKAWGVFFGPGEATNGSVSNAARVRCVR